MQNFVPLGTGNSRLMKSNIPAGTTWEQAIAMLNSGTFPYDTGQLNAAGISVEGTPLNKQTLLQDSTAQQFGLTGDATVDQVLQNIPQNFIKCVQSGLPAVSISALQIGDTITIDNVSVLVVASNHFASNTVTVLASSGSAHYNTNSYDGSAIDTACGNFYDSISAGLQSLIVPTSIQIFNGTTSNAVETISRNCFLLSANELGSDSFFDGSLGTAIPYFNGTTLEFSSNWWTRTKKYFPPTEGVYVGSNGGFASTVSSNTAYSVRPAFNLNANGVLYQVSPGNYVTENKVTNTFYLNGAEISLGAQIATGSYVGTGTYGEDNPNSLTFGFEPDFVFLLGSFDLNSERFSRGPQGISVLDMSILSNSYRSYNGFSSTSSVSSSSYGKKSSDNKTVYWYNTSNAYGQINAINIQVFYMAVKGI